MDEEIFDFEFDDLPEGDVEETKTDSASEDEVIELVDVVEEGDVLEDLDSEMDDLIISTDDEMGEDKADDLTIAMESDDLFGEMSDDDSEDLTISMDSDDLIDEHAQEEPELSLDADLTSEPSLEDLELSEDADLNLEESDLESLADMDGDDASVLKLEDLVEPEDIEEAEIEMDDDLMEEDGPPLAPDADIDAPLEARELTEQTDQEQGIQEVDAESTSDEESSLGLEGPAERDTSEETVALEQEEEPAEETEA